MAFEREVNRIVDGVGAFRIMLRSPNPLDAEDARVGLLFISLLMSDGTSRDITVSNFLTRLGDDPEGIMHRNNLADLETYIRNRLETELVPV